MRERGLRAFLLSFLLSSTKSFPLHSTFIDRTQSRSYTAASSLNAHLTDDDDESSSSPSSSDHRDAGGQHSTLQTTRRALLSAMTASASGGLLLILPPSSASSMRANAYYDEEAKRIAIFEKTSPSVVFIDTFAERRDVFSTNIMEVPLGSGSGFVWDLEGHIVTNYHVVRNAAVAQVAILTDGKSSSLIPAATDSIASTGSSSSSSLFETSMRPSNQKRSVFKATVVGVDPSKDVAVLKVNAPRKLLQPIAVGTSSGLKVGQQALAIGNPFGLDHTLTAGIISGTGRQVTSPSGRPITNVIQSDAAINPGNSGGPLLDSSGKLIGMNTAIYSPSGASAGIGFAIPIDTVKYIVETLIRDGRVVRPVLGISFLESRQARALGIGSGVLVLEVPEGTPAAKAGLKGTRRTEAGLVEIGDIINKVGNKIIDSEADLFQALEDYKPGDVVKITVSRVTADGDQLTVREIVLSVQLQSSVDLEKNMQAFQYQMQ